MIINDNDAKKRLDSPMNLINRLRSANGSKKNNAMTLFGIGLKKEESKAVERSESFFNPFQPQEPTPEPLQETNLDTILKNNESQIKLGLAHDRSIDLLNRAVDMLATKLDDVSASKLPSVISAASKTVESIRKERIEAARNNKDREVHFHFYTPEQKKVSDYEVIDVA